MQEAATAPAPKRRRQLRNYLLDRHFQLKYAGLLVAAAALISGALGLLLWRTSTSLVAQSRTAVEQGQHAVELGRDVTRESRKVSEVVRMNIVKDPMYGDNPELLAAFKADADKQDEALLKRQRALEAQAAALAQQATALAAKQRTTLWTLGGILLVLVLALGLVGIVVTHRVAGPIFKMTRQLGRVRDGDLTLPAPLRKGDELAHFFEAFEAMVGALRKQNEAHLERLDQALEALGEAAPEDVSKPLRALRGQLEQALGD